MNIEEIPQIITAIQDDIKMLKSAINPKPEIHTDSELKVLLKDNTIADDDAEMKLEDIKGIIVPLLNGKAYLSIRSSGNIRFFLRAQSGMESR
jgi:hypothetical protein